MFAFCMLKLKHKVELIICNSLGGKTCQDVSELILEALLHLKRRYSSDSNLN